MWHIARVAVSKVHHIVFVRPKSNREKIVAWLIPSAYQSEVCYASGGPRSPARPTENDLPPSCSVDELTRFDKPPAMQKPIGNYGHAP